MLYGTASTETSNPGSKSWTQALGACTSLKRLEIEQVNTRSLHLLTETLKTGLPTLDAIQINRRDYEIPDQDLADMLSACRSGGWRSISLPMLGLIAAEALVKHCPTFETLELKLVGGLSSISMRKILRSSPRLESFITLVKDDCCAFSVGPGFH
ncbi:hypothetical protein BGX29_007880 [Mortierella sp. GBA35]|nr:hypothetical protein BGX29_007880 [Mortierella sp. GBA35]